MKKQRGITLIALIITIIILLILAGVTLNVLTGENGLLSKSTTATMNTYHATVKEQIILGADQYFIDTKTNKYTDTFIKYLKENGFTTEIDSTYDRVNVEEIAKNIKTGKGSTKEDGDIYVIEEYIQNGTASIIEIAATDPVNVGVKNYVLRYYETSDNFIDLLYLDGKGNVTDPNPNLDLEDNNVEQNPDPNFDDSDDDDETVSNLTLKPIPVESEDLDDFDLKNEVATKTLTKQITYIEDLLDFAMDVNNGNSYEGQQVKLLNDLDFTNKNNYRSPDTYWYYKNNPISLDSLTATDSYTSTTTVFDELQVSTGFPAPGFLQIASSEDTPFKGEFNGNGKTISNLFMGGFEQYGSSPTNRANMAMFGYNEGRIINLNINGFSAKSTAQIPISVLTYSNKGTVSGININADIAFSSLNTNKNSMLTITNDGVIKNCTLRGTLTTKVDMAVAVDTNNGTVSKVYNICNVTQSGNTDNIRVSGIVNTNSSTGVVKYSTNYGNITTEANAAGVVVANNGEVRKCVNRGTIKTKSWLGGIVYINNKKVSYCSNYGNLCDAQYIGGIIYNNSNSTESIEYCFNGKKGVEQDINGASQMGAGIVLTVAQNNQDITITNCSNYMNFKTGKSTSGIAHITGSSTINSVTINNCYNYGDTTGNGILYTEHPTVRTLSITDCANSGEIGNYEFSAGIVGRVMVSNNAIISNCTNTGNISSGSGGIIGQLEGDTKNTIITISDCKNFGNVSNASTDGAGGIIGRIYENVKPFTATITGCKNEGVISTGRTGTGGIIGWNYANLTISDCENTGIVTGSLTDCAGIIGRHDSGNDSSTLLIERCDNTAQISANAYNIAGILGKDVSIGEGVVIDSCNNYGRIISSGSGGKAGGIVGTNSSTFTIKNSINAGEIISTNRICCRNFCKSYGELYYSKLC